MRLVRLLKAGSWLTWVRNTRSRRQLRCLVFESACIEISWAVKCSVACKLPDDYDVASCSAGILNQTRLRVARTPWPRAVPPWASSIERQIVKPIPRTSAWSCYEWAAIKRKLPNKARVEFLGCTTVVSRRACDVEYPGAICRMSSCRMSSVPTTLATTASLADGGLACGVIS
jgi:hypothetical protein